MSTAATSPPRRWDEGRRLRAWELKQQGRKQAAITTALGVTQGAAAAFKRLAVGLDEPIARVVSTRPGLEPTMAALGACRPDRLAG